MNIFLTHRDNDLHTAAIFLDKIYRVDFEATADKFDSAFFAATMQLKSIASKVLPAVNIELCPVSFDSLLKQYEDAIKNE